MSGISSRLVRAGAHGLLGNRRWLRSHLARFDSARRPQRILEIGSGKAEGGEYTYSMQSLFPDAEFVMSDIEPEFGHRIIDVTNLDIVEEFDAILCISVLEHLPDPSAATRGILRALRSDGTAIIGVPAAYPLHDEPADYWRFTEHGLRMLLQPFSSVRVEHRGPRKLPTGLLAFASA